MQVVSTKDFATDINRYFDLARREQLLVNDGNYTFRIALEIPQQQVKQKKFLQPDADFHSAISMDEFKKRARLMLKDLDEKYAKK